MTAETTESKDQFGNMEERLAELCDKMETTIHEDRILLLYIDRVANHCKRALASMEAHQPEVALNGNTDTGGTSFQEPESTASSTTDTTSSEKRNDSSIVALESQESLSVLEARQLFPGKPFSEGSLGLKSPESSSSPSSSRTQFVRTITHVKEQQVRAIMSTIKRRMQRRSTA